MKESHVAFFFVLMTTEQKNVFVFVFVFIPGDAAGGILEK